MTSSTSNKLEDMTMEVTTVTLCILWLILLWVNGADVDDNAHKNDNIQEVQAWAPKLLCSVVQFPGLG